MSARFSEAVRNAAVDARAAMCNNGYKRIYDGVRPASPDTAITTQNLIVTLRYSATAYGAAVAGVATANAIASGVAIYSPSATATWCRNFASDGTTVLFDEDVSTSGSDINLANTLIVYNSTVNIDSSTLSEP